ncbi:unnamed protein product [Peronospora effusa]|nr:unnamed protein product [Peronospora effusa]
MGLSQILQHTSSVLTPEDRAYLDSPLTANDFYWALQHTASGKTPGPDGLPLDYYKVDLPLWSRILEVIYGAQFYKGKMTKFQRRAQISLLYKHGDRSLPSNYRPITLLNVDAKLGPKILAHRLGRVLKYLLHSDQSGFVPGRDIRQAHIRFQALAQLYSTSDTPAGAVQLDFAKAFDSVVWDALDMVLQHFGFGQSFRRWIKVLFPGTLVSLMFNGRPLAPFELEAGVCQGDPLSPALFVLFIEPFLNFLRAKLQDMGILCGSSTHSIISFADDCTGLLHDLRHTKDFLGFVDQFCSATGMRLNTAKTVVLPFRPWSAATEPLRLELEQLGVDVVGNSGRTKLLGIYYGPQLRNADRLQHLFSASVCHVPATGFQDQVSTLISRFLCKSKSNIALPKDWWFLPPGLGGLGLTPVSDMIHSLQVHMLCKVIVAARTHSIAGVPSWVEPVIRLFDQAISPWGQDFDILYAPVSTSPDYAKSHRWAQLGDYWHSVLFV